MARTKKETDENAVVDSEQPINQSASGTSETVQVKPIRRFTDTASGQFKAPGDAPFSVDRVRAAELEANGLIIRVTTTPEPNNKMAPEPNTKG